MNDIPASMKAAVHMKYGEPEDLVIQTIPVPEPPSGHYLVQVRAIALNPADWKYLEGRWRFLTGKRFPRQVGIEFSGTIIKAGNAAHEFSVGEEVFGSVNAFKTGTAAQYVSASGHAIARKPVNVSFQEAAGIPIAGGTAYMGYRGANHDLSGKRVLVTGAGGGVGHLAVQFAKLLNAEVVAVCSAEKAALVKEFGADKVIDYRSSDITTHKAQYDTIFDCAGTIGTRNSKSMLKPGGEFLLLEIAGKLWLFVSSWLSQRFAQKKMRTYLAHPSSERCEALATLFSEGKLSMKIGACFPFSEISDAMRMVKNGHALGKVIVDIQ